MERVDSKQSFMRLNSDINDLRAPSMAIETTSWSETTSRALIAVLILLCERTCFLWILFNDTTELWVTLLITAVLHMAYYAVYTKVSKKKHKEQLYLAFKLSRTPAVSYLKLSFLG
eukprot:TRINITY_DN6947_c0_g1_i5.p1 TRINITY_DN6947_c0_g1~~TRINITY_DN6947_c0_g1_i5.p1  ORF type:complete len:116 (+),score=19.77 TRINITY_DN6947_c0_g1_i5:93-440(+)